MVRAHLLKTNPDKNFQIAVIEEAMSNFFRYFFIMPTPPKVTDLNLAILHPPRLIASNS